MNYFRLKYMIFNILLIPVFPLAGVEALLIKTGAGPGLPATDYRRKRIAPGSLLGFLTANAGWLKMAGVDKKILRLIALQKEYLKTYERQLLSGAANPKLNNYNAQDLNQWRKIREINIQELVRNIRTDGFILSSAGEIIYPEIDYLAISARFGGYCSRPVAEYLRIMARETARHFTEGTTLRISPDALGRRIAAIETWLGKNPGFIWRNEVHELGHRYLAAYLMGMDDTPAFDRQTNRLNKWFYQSYQFSIAKYPGTKFAGLLKDYFNLLTENDFQKTKPVLDFTAKVVADIY